MMLFTSGGSGPDDDDGVPVTAQSPGVLLAFVTKGQVASTIVIPFPSSAARRNESPRGADDHLSAGDLLDRLDDAHSLLLKPRTVCGL